MKTFSEYLAEEDRVSDQDMRAHHHINNSQTPHRIISKYANASVAVKSHLLETIFIRGYQDGFISDPTVTEITRDLYDHDYLDEPVLIHLLGSEPYEGIFGTMLEYQDESDIPFITDPVKVAACKSEGVNILHINNPTPDMVKAALTEPMFIDQEPELYEQFVKKHFKSNSIMMNKWLRYAENVRNM
jgi:hypothetical protein